MKELSDDLTIFEIRALIKSMKKTVILLLVICFQFQLNAQMITPKSSFNVELGLPNTLANKSFNSMIQGLLNIGIYYQYAFDNSLAIGGGLRYSFLEVNQFKVPEPIDGAMHSAGAYIKVSREKFHTERFGTDMGVKFGYAKNYFSTDLNKLLGQNPHQVDAVYIEPCIGLVLTADESTSYRLHVGYAIQGFGFRPDRLGTQMNGGYDASEFNKATQYLIVGFGFTYYFKGKTQ